MTKKLSKAVAAAPSLTAEEISILNQVKQSRYTPAQLQTLLEHFAKPDNEDKVFTLDFVIRRVLSHEELDLFEVQGLYEVYNLREMLRDIAA